MMDPPPRRNATAALRRRAVNLPRRFPKPTKPKSKVWKHFKELDVSGRKEYECEFCSRRYKSQHATRFMKHLLSCKQCPEPIQLEFQLLTKNARRETNDLSRKCDIYEVEDDENRYSSGDKDGGGEIHQRSRRRNNHDTGDVIGVGHTMNILSILSENSQDSPCLESYSISNLPHSRPPTPCTAHQRSSTPLSSHSQGSHGIERLTKIMPIEEQDRLNELFARAVYTSGIGCIRMAENREWEEFFRRVNPAFKVPDRQMLANTLLNAEYTRVEIKVKEMLQEADSLCLQLDGWTNRNGEAIINVIITSPTPVLYKTIETRLEQHDHEKLAQLIEEFMQEIDYSKFEGIITNNASVMLKATSLVASKYPHIHSYPCATHSLDLLLQDLMKMNSAKELITICSDIVTKVNGNSVLRSTFNKIQFEKSSKVINLKHHTRTKSTSWRNCMTSLLDTQNSLKLLWVDDEYSHLIQDKQDLKFRILDDNFWVKVNDLNNFIKKTVEWIMILESNTSQISYIAECFLKIKNDMLAALSSTSVFTTNEKKSIKRLLDFREGKMLHPIHFAANILDPNFRGKILSQTQEISAMEFIEKKIGQVFHNERDVVSAFGELAQYRCSHGFFAKEYVKKSAETIDPLTWWMGICSSSSISKVSQKILAMPATSTAIEHSFSAQSFMHSARKNRLTAQMAQKITFIKCNLKLFQSVYDSRRLVTEVHENEQVEVDQGDKEECDVDGEAEDANSGDEFRLFEAEELELERFVDEIEIDVDF